MTQRRYTANRMRNMLTQNGTEKYIYIFIKFINICMLYIEIENIYYIKILINNNNHTQEKKYTRNNIQAKYARKINKQKYASTCAR